MTISTGLYALKPWYARTLGGLRKSLAKQRVSPNLVSWAGVGFAALAGAALWWIPAGPAAFVVIPLLAARLAAANLDGGLARESGRTTPWGCVLNELTDRLSDLVMLAGLCLLLPLPLGLAMLAAATLPSWVSIAGAAAGMARINGGPMGKTERCLMVALIALIPGFAVPGAWIITGGAFATAVLRVFILARRSKAVASPGGR